MKFDKYLIGKNKVKAEEEDEMFDYDMFEIDDLSDEEMDMFVDEISEMSEGEEIDLLKEILKHLEDAEEGVETMIEHEEGEEKEEIEEEEIPMGDEEEEFTMEELEEEPMGLEESKKVKSNDEESAKKRLEEFRKMIENDEDLSYGELAELQDLAEYIDPDDVLLLEWAGVEEFGDFRDELRKKKEQKASKVKSYDEEEEEMDEMLREPISVQEAKDIIDEEEPVYFDEETATFYAFPPAGIDVKKIIDFLTLKDVVEKAEEGVYASCGKKHKKKEDKKKEEVKSNKQYKNSEGEIVCDSCIRGLDNIEPTQEDLDENCEPAIAKITYIDDRDKKITENLCDAHADIVTQDYEVISDKEINAKKMTDEAEEFISKKIAFLMEEEDMPQDQAIAVAYSMAREEGYDVPENPNKKKAKIESADQYSTEVKELETNDLPVEEKKSEDFNPKMEKEEEREYVPFRETFEDVVKANKKINDLMGKGYENIKITRYTKIEGEERLFWWEVLAQLPRRPEMEEIKTKFTKPMENQGTGERIIVDKDGKEIKAELKFAFGVGEEVKVAGEEYKDSKWYMKKGEIIEQVDSPSSDYKLLYQVNIDGENVAIPEKDLIKAFAEAYDRLKEKAPAPVSEYDIVKTDKGYAVQEKGKQGSEGFVGDFTATEMEELFGQGWESQVKEEVKANEEEIEKAKLKAIDKLIKEQEKLIDAFYNDDGTDKIKVKKDIEAVTQKIEDIKSGKINIMAEPQETNMPEPKPEDLDKPAGEDEAEMDAFDLTDGVALGEGYIAHKDPETGEIYVIDKEGTEVMRNPNAFVDDVTKIIEFYQSVLNIEQKEEPKPEETPSGEDVSIEEEVVEEEPKGIEETLEDIKDKVNELVDMEKGQGQEEELTEEDEEADTKNNEELAKLKKEMDEKKQQVEQVLTSLNENKMIVVSRGDIQRHIIAGENPIFAKKKAKEEKIKRLAKKLWAMDNETIKILEETLIAKGEKKSSKMSSVLSLLED